MNIAGQGFDGAVVGALGGTWGSQDVQTWCEGCPVQRLGNQG